MMNKKYTDPAPVYIIFEEITDLQMFSSVGAEAYLYPDLSLSMRQTKDYGAMFEMR